MVSQGVGFKFSVAKGFHDFGKNFFLKTKVILKFGLFSFNLLVTQFHLKKVTLSASEEGAIEHILRQKRLYGCDSVFCQVLCFLFCLLFFLQLHKNKIMTGLNVLL